MAFEAGDRVGTAVANQNYCGVAITYLHEESTAIMLNVLFLCLKIVRF